MSLADLPLGSLAGQLLAFLQDPEARESWDRFMEAAALTARLIQWKSLTLLPAAPGTPSTVAAELRREIEEQFRDIERARLVRVRNFLLARLLAEGGSLETLSPLAAFQPQPEEPALFPSLWTLRKKFQTLRDRTRQRRKEEALPLAFPIPQREEVSTGEMTQWLQSRIAPIPPGEWIPSAALFQEAGDRARQVALFGAVLELARDSLTLDQPDDDHCFSLAKVAEQPSHSSL